MAQKSTDTHGGIEERYYTVKHLAERLGMSFSRAYLLVKDEPGVLRFPQSGRDGKPRPGRRVMYRVPESVVLRILRRNTNP